MLMLHTAGEVEDQLSRFCHDLRQYVATGLLMTGVEDGDPGSEADVRLATIHTLFRQIGLLIDAEVGDTGRRRTSIDLPEIIGDCVQVARGRDVEIHARVAPSATAFGDPVLLRRAVTNVLDNAVRAEGGHGCICVEVSVAGDESIIEVTDDGVGFGRGPHGTGQGMSIVALAVETCDGRLEIASGPAPGTTVRMVLPRNGVAS
jgi:signal transduction histidine kinase